MIHLGAFTIARLVVDELEELLDDPEEELDEDGDEDEDPQEHEGWL